MNLQVKVCPLMAAWPIEVNRLENRYTCIGERCAWYTGGECAVLCAADNMKKPRKKAGDYKEAGK